MYNYCRGYEVIDLKVVLWLFEKPLQKKLKKIDVFQ